MDDLRQTLLEQHIVHRVTSDLEEASRHRSVEQHIG